MEFDIMYAIIGVLGAGLGFLGSRIAGKKVDDKLIQEMNAKAELILKEAKVDAQRITSEANSKADKIVNKAESVNEKKKQKKIQEAREHWNKKKEEFKDYKSKRLVEIKDQEKNLQELKNQLTNQQKDFDSRLEDLEIREQQIKNEKTTVRQQMDVVEKKKKLLDEKTDEAIKRLETVAKMNQNEAKEELLEAVRAKAESEAMAIEKETILAARNSANKQAKKIVIQTIQRMCAEYTIENTVTVFNLTSDDLKGQIIGREGRNIRALEAATGAEIVVDDTPEAIVISSFDAIRREVCRLSLKKLVDDGRIHPGRIEEVVAKVKKELEQQIIEIGEQTVIDLDLHGLDPYLIRMVGRMRFRSSYGQNLLKHSMETANLCAAMAAELGLNKKEIKLAKRAGLLHDIGKVTEEDSELSHALIGMKMCEKVNEHAAVINAVGAHHDEIEMNNIISPIVQACDAISGARPGARREILESYLNRIGELEEIALGYDGVQKAYALQAGRELRVIVESDKVSDDYADDLSFMISQKIQNEMQYPGQIKVTVIREKRATSIAR